MFNIKNIVSKITDRGRNSVSSDDYTEQGAEGFLCPKCMTAFITPEELHNHYESQHKEDSASVVSSGSFDSVKDDHQINKMDSSDNISEIFDIMDVNLLRDKLVDSLKVNTKLKSEKEHLEQVAANLAHANVSLKAASDEAVDNQTAIGERLKIVEAQLAHRESIDDAAVLRQELVQVQRYMDELTREKEREVEELKEKLKDLLEIQQQQTINIPKENENLEKKLSDITKDKETENQKFQEEIIGKNNEISVLINSLKKEKETNKESKDTITKIEIVNQTLQGENKELKDDIESIKKKLNEQHNKLEEFIKLEQEHVQLANKLESCKNELNYTKEVLDQEVLKHQSAAKAINLSKNKINIISENIKSKFIPNDQIQQTEKDFIINQINDLLKIISPDIQNIEDEIQKQNINLQRELRQAHIKIDEIEKTKNDFEKTIEKNNLEMSMIEKQLKETLEKIQTSEKNLREYERLNESFKIELETSVKEKNDEIMDLKKNISDLLKTKGEFESLKIKMKEMSVKYNDLCKESKTNNENLKIELEKYKKLEIHLNKENAQLKTEITNLREELSDLREALHNSNKSINIFENKVSEMDETIFRINEKNKNILEDLSLKLTEFNEIEAECEELKDKLNKSLKNTTELNHTILEAKTHNEELSTTISDLTAQVQDLKVEKTSLDTNIFQLEKLIAELESEKKDIEETHNKIIEKYQDTINNTKKEIVDLEETNKIVIQENTELKTQIISIKEKYELDNKEFKAQEKSLQDIIKQQKSELTDCEKQIKSEEYDKIKFKESIEEINKNFEFKMDQNNSEILTLKSSLDELTGNKLELQAQLETCQSEQKTLLERYYLSSFDNEKLHETISDLRRKLEDSQSALHELGRENQTLQLELEKLFGRKWTEDSDVANCNLCRKEFSIINRRHHCRNCGQIFCNDCSSKLAPVSNNKKPVRVCDSCYNELSSK